jgi:hypothetical protein
MNVCVRILFNPLTEEDWAAMRSLGGCLTHEPGSVQVSADAEPNWLIATFTMPTEPQYKAVEKVDRAIRLWVNNRWDSTISFPRTEAERRRADRRAARRKARRQSRREDNG